jgi:hypothetical protein
MGHGSWAINQSWINHILLGYPCHGSKGRDMHKSLPYRDFSWMGNAGTGGWSACSTLKELGEPI